MTDGEDPSLQWPLDSTPRGRRFLGRAAGAAAVAWLVAFAVFAAGLIDLAIQEDRRPLFDDDDYTEIAIWCAIAGALAFVLGVFLFRRGAARTLAAMSALCFVVLIGGLGTLFTLNETNGAQSAPIERLEPSEENIRKIIARELQVPEDRVVPGARFDTDLNAHEVDMQEMVELQFQSIFGLDYSKGDEDMLITVQDAFDYVAAPAQFREAHRGQSRYPNAGP